MNTPKKHWCVLKDDTMMWFRGKQVLFLQVLFKLGIQENPDKGFDFGFDIFRVAITCCSSSKTSVNPSPDINNVSMSLALQYGLAF